MRHYRYTLAPVLLYSLVITSVLGYGAMVGSFGQELSNTSLIIITLALLPILIGYIMDYILGDPNSFHPIVGFGKLISWGEQRLNQGNHRTCKGLFYNGLLIVLIMGLGLCCESWYLVRLPDILWDNLLSEHILIWGVATLVIHSVLLFLMLSGTTLIKEVEDVFTALDKGLEQGRRQVSRIVGRDTANLSEQEVRTAALETLSENLSDGVIAPLFWYGILGLPGILGYKMINTQDSMIGYLNQRYRAYGYFSAKIDDLVNYIPSRLTALIMIFVAGRCDLVRFVGKYGSKHLSPNSGYPEAALAGILRCRFGGPHDYFGEVIDKPYIGEEERPLTMSDARLAVRINRRAEIVMLGITAIMRLLFLIVLSQHS